MSERAKRCGNCGAWAPTWKVRNHKSIDQDRRFNKRALGECRRTHEIFIERHEHQWCCDWLPREEA